MLEAPATDLPVLLQKNGTSNALCDVIVKAIVTLGFEDAITHCQQHSKNAQSFNKQFNQWFDGLKTLQFIHAIRDDGYRMLALNQLANHEPLLLPDLSRPADTERIKSELYHQWGWMKENTH